MKFKMIWKNMIIGLCILFVCSACSKVDNNKQLKDDEKETNIISTEIAMYVSGLHNGDAKMYGTKVITSVEGVLTLLNEDGSVANKYDIKSNWLANISEDGLIVYSNANKQLGIVRLDENNNVVDNHILMESENYLIDPTITTVNGEYYITVTEIEGTVNNANANVDNGKYTICLYKLVNYKEVILINNIISENYNLEDIDMFFENGCFYMIYEKEVLDKGKSMINVIKSIDESGKAWQEEIQLIAANSDNEPAAVESNEKGYRLYYSSDKDFLGESYMGGKIYYADFDKNFKCLSKDNCVVTKTEKGILLYDVFIDGKQQWFLYAKDYLSNCDLVIEKK